MTDYQEQILRGHFALLKSEFETRTGSDQMQLLGNISAKIEKLIRKSEGDIRDELVLLKKEIDGFIDLRLDTRKETMKPMRKAGSSGADSNKKVS